MDTEDLSPSSHKKIFRTKESFSANVMLTDEGNSIRIRLKKEGKKAYLNIIGCLEGQLSDCVFAGAVCRVSGGL